MQLHNIRHFLAVCETGSINKAAELCNVSQPSITRSIKNLEQEFNGSLFDRSADGCHLTPLGQEVKPQFDQLALTLDTVKDVAQRSIDRSMATLRFGITCTLSPVPIRSFLEHLHTLSNSAQSRVFDAPSERIVDRILEGDLDAGLAAEPSYSSGLHHIPLYKERYVVSFHKGHRFENMTAIELSELEKENYVSRLNCELRGRVNDYIPNNLNLKMNIVFQSSQEQWIQSMVASGSGVAIHPETMPVMDSILQRPLDNPKLSRTVSLVMLESRSELPILRRLKSLIRQHVSW